MIVRKIFTSKEFSVISRIITGIVFTYSGFVKAVDPIGTEIKFHEYFEAMGMEWLSPLALIFSFLMNAAEFIIGLMLLINVFPKLTAWAGLLFMAIFTPLTFWLAVANPVTDCGCFGDAVKLTNWETFWKNIILLLFIITLFINRKKTKNSFNFKYSFIITSAFVLLVFGFEFFNFKNLPLIDFRPYKVGVNIYEKAITPEDAPKDEYESIILYKNIKTGKSEEFTIDNCPYDDTLNWAFDTTYNKLIKKGYEPPIKDFIISDTNKKKKDITKKILSDEKYSFILVSTDLDKANKKNIAKINKLADYCNINNLNFYCITASGTDEIEKFKGKLPETINFCTADKKMLKTFIRSNPGLVILKKGTIIKKYHYRNIPDIKDIKLIF